MVLTKWGFSFLEARHVCNKVLLISLFQRRHGVNIVVTVKTRTYTGISIGYHAEASRSYCANKSLFAGAYSDKCTYILQGR